jgi:methionyl-tRNA formyltransferase
VKILLLSPNPQGLFPTFARHSDEVTVLNERLDDAFLTASSFDLIVSYGYRYILRGLILEKYRDKIVNLHISYLPWNAGADPNFWSFFEGSPKGVTIHLIDAGVDTGDIIAQRLVDFSEEETLQTTYKKLQAAIEALFSEIWPALRIGKASRTKQTGAGSRHLVRDKASHMLNLPLGWDTPVSDVERLGEKHRKGEGLI